jgi:hypothetical protein
MIYCAVHRAVGWAVALMWTTCLLLWSSTTKPYKMLKVTVGTMKKSMATILFFWTRGEIELVGFYRSCRISAPPPGARLV